MMSQLGWEELRLRRARIKTILLFKIVNNLVDIPPEPFLIPTGTITRGHNIRFLQPHTRTITMQYIQLKTEGVVLWYNGGVGQGLSGALQGSHAGQLLR
jgi:hypothetical protein